MSGSGPPRPNPEHVALLRERLRSTRAVTFKNGSIIKAVGGGYQTTWRGKHGSQVIATFGRSNLEAAFDYALNGSRDCGPQRPWHRPYPGKPFNYQPPKKGKAPAKDADLDNDRPF